MLPLLIKDGLFIASLPSTIIFLIAVHLVVGEAMVNKWQHVTVRPNTTVSNYSQ